MSFYNKYLEYKDFDFNVFFENVNDLDINNILKKNNLNELDFLALLSPTASNHLEEMAIKAHNITTQYLGKNILLYTPMYIANYCSNVCSYCSFNAVNKISRKKLSMDEIEEEAKAISKDGFKHILVLTGESRSKTPVSYIKDAVMVLKKYFHSIAIEIYPLYEDEYRELVEAGVDSLTIYQETYDEEVYDKVHIKGEKKNYKFRLDAPERGCISNMRAVNIGALLGLSNPKIDSFFTGIHGKYLQDKYIDVEVSFSVPRIRPHIGHFEDVNAVYDKDLVQIILALKIFMPRSGINISTREYPSFRDNLIPLGITKMSAGVSTQVGGHSQDSKSDAQFEISDDRSVAEIMNVIKSKGYQPIFKDWQLIKGDFNDIYSN